MMKNLVLLGTVLSGCLWGADQATLDRGKQEEAKTCVPCHSLRLVHSQRLSRATWIRELDKMTNWGTKIGDREALLEYLVANYGDDKPVPQPAVSGNGSNAK